MFKPFDQSIQLSPERILARGLSLLSETNDKTFVYKENKTGKLHQARFRKDFRNRIRGSSGTRSSAAAGVRSDFREGS